MYVWGVTMKMPFQHRPPRSIKKSGVELQEDERLAAGCAQGCEAANRSSLHLHYLALALFFLRGQPHCSASLSPLVPTSPLKLWTLPHFQWPLPSGYILQPSSLQSAHTTLSPPQNHLPKEATTRLSDRGPRLIFHTALSLVMVNYEPTFL